MFVNINYILMVISVCPVDALCLLLKTTNLLKY